MTLSISTRLILIVVLLVSMTAGTISYYLYQNSVDILTNHALIELSQNLQRDGLHITDHVDELQRDVSFLSESPPIPGLIRAQNNKAYDPVGQSSSQQWLKRLTSLSRTLLSTNPSYLQVRVLKANGHEWVKVERINSGIITLPPKSLQDKSQTDYFKDITKLKPGEIYFSPINLNREFGKITEPHTPVLRCAKPIYDQGKLFAIVIINLNMSVLLSDLENLYASNQQNLYVTNSQGAYISHPQPERRFAIELGHYFRIQEDFPQLASLYAPGNTQKDFYAIPNDKTGNILVFVKIPFIKLNPDQFIGIGLTRSLDALIEEESRVLQQSSAIVVSLVILSILLAAAFGNLLVRPLKQIAASLQGFNQGEIPDLPIKRNDEIGILSRALYEMADNVFSSHQELRTLNANLEDEVEARTEEVQQNYRLLNTISRAQTAFIGEPTTQHAFEIMLAGLLEVGDSEYGFIGEVMKQDDGTPYLKTHAITNIAWNEETRRFYADNVESGLEFYNLDSLFGQVMVTGEAVISNDPAHDERATGIPEGHPPLNAFLGIPIFSGDRLVGMAGIANRSEGYDQNVLQQLEPFVTTCANMIASIQARDEAMEKDRQLQEARSELERVISQSPVVFYTARAHGDFGATFISPNIKQQLGYEPEEFTSNPNFWIDNIHPDDREATLNELGQLFEHGHHTHQYRFKDHNGQYHWMQDELQLIRDEQGEPQELAGYWLDISGRKLAEEAMLASEKKFRSVVDSSPMGIFIYRLIDNELIFSDFNKAANDILGIDCQQFIGKTIQQAFPLLPDEIPEAYRRAAKDGIPWHNDDTYYDDKQNIVGAYDVYAFQTEPNTMAAMFMDVTERKHTELNLKQSERELATILDNLPLMMFLKDADDLRFARFNRAGEELLGTSRDKLIGKNDYDFFPKEQADFFTAKDREVLKAGQTVDIQEEPIQTPQGERILHTRKTVITDAQGRPRYLLGLSEDITEEKQIKDELSRFKATLDQTQDCVFMFDSDNLQYFYVNQGASFLVGYTTEELLQMHPYEINYKLKTEEDFRSFVEPLVNQKQLSLNFETDYRCKDGGLVPVEVILQYISHEDQSPRFIAMVRDITERKKVDRMKNEFISTVSHEIRTPLTSIRGSLGLITGGAAGDIPEQIQRMIEIASNNTDRLLLLINDILDIQKIESGQLDFQFKPLEVMSLIEQAVENNEAYANQFNVKFKITQRQDEIMVMGDHDRLMQVMNNLMSNAAKFSPEHDVVELAVEHDKNNVCISVTDHGDGIPEEFQPSLFDQFTQSDSSDSRQKGGTGLGLSIVKAITDKHNGRIRYTTALGKGTTMVIEIPVYITTSNTIT
ncbi:MAG: PAS domain S-box protein [Gammaproteobacteria bacterium]|nr:PAS domain S-box protein [Gammaproteobacteria bacterium]